MVGIGTGDLLTDSSSKIFELSEFGIEVGGIIPHSYKHYDENATQGKRFYQQLCWDFLPEEEPSFGESDDWGYPSHHYHPHDSKRELFISNSERIETIYGELVEEISHIFGGAFYQLNGKARDIRVINIDEVSTCLLYWK